MTLIPGAETVHPRTEWQNSAYPVTGPLDNPSNNDTIVIHYTAADDLIDGDPGEHIEDMDDYHRSMQYQYVTKRRYSLGYSWSVDYLGGIWQIRGWEYQSAANAGHNDHTIPILVLVDGGDPATDLAARSIRLIVAEAERRFGRKMAIKGHGQLREETGIGTATQCPGVGLRSQIAAGVFVPTSTLPPPTVPPPDDEEEMAYIAIPPPERAGQPWLYVSSSVRPATTFDIEDGVPRRPMEKIPVQYRVQQYDFLKQAAGL